MEDKDIAIIRTFVATPMGDAAAQISAVNSLGRLVSRLKSLERENRGLLEMLKGVEETVEELEKAIGTAAIALGYEKESE